MSLTRAPIPSCVISDEECYCAPWDLKMQEEKLKLINEQHQISLPNLLLHSSNNTNQSISQPSHRTYLAHKSSRKKSFTHRELSPPVLPPFPPGGLISSCQCTETLDPSTIHSDVDTSHSFLFVSKALPNKCTQRIESVDTQPHLNSSIQNNSLPKLQTSYKQPWDALGTSVINNLHGRSLPKIPNIEQDCSSSTFPIVSSCQHSDDAATIPIDRYSWYHYAISRRQAEHVLESRPSGSFLVRQSESGNQNDYSLSIKTTKGFMHMRICYSNGFYILGECSRPFSSVSCMIKYFSQTFVPIRGAAHIKLGTPVLRWEILSSSLSHEELL